jgi:hypothetical protein
MNSTIPTDCFGFGQVARAIQRLVIIGTMILQSASAATNATHPTASIVNRNCPGVAEFFWNCGSPS